MIGSLKIDKASMKIDYFLQSILIVKNNGGRISRSEFVSQMEIYMYGKANFSENEDVRTQYNKSKLVRYFGLLKLIKSETSKYDDLIITKRGVLASKCIDTKGTSRRIFPEKEHKFSKIILDSVLYDSFGKSNDGVETSLSEIEPPKVLLKAILLLGYITSEEFIYILFGLDKGIFDSFDDAILKIKHIRKNNDSDQTFIKEQIEKLGKNNFVGDNKLIKFFMLIHILDLNEETKQYTIKSEILNKYKNQIQQLNPVSRPMQMILSGVPGTGKSYYVDNCILGGISNKNNVVRTIIHPDYCYSDFVGFIKPHSDGGKINYKFSPGPFSIILGRAIKNPKENYYLVIEEMNRGNIASIMGDTFQLLDRVDNFKDNKHGWSQYHIENKDIYNYLKYDCGINLKDILSLNKIKLPSNFHIIGTMNTADQNVFVLDTAFRRRFRNLYLRINFSDAKVKGSYLNQLDQLSNKVIFDNREGQTWSSFAIKVNKLIDDINSEMLAIPEDKKLAAYFIDKSDISTRQDFCDKVIYYLKNDVFKYVENVMPESYQQIYNNIVYNNVNPFDLIKIDGEIYE